MAWITTDDVEAALGVATAPGDAAYLAMATDAANGWAFRRRHTAGYVDDVDMAPGAEVKLGTVLYAVGLYRERGSVDSYASFDDLAGGFAPSGSMGQINRLLGIGKPAVDKPTDYVPVPTPGTGADEVAVQTDEPADEDIVLWVDTDA